MDSVHVMYMYIHMSIIRIFSEIFSEEKKKKKKKKKNHLGICHTSIYTRGGPLVYALLY